MRLSSIELFKRILRDVKVGSPCIVVAVKEDSTLVDVEVAIQDQKMIEGRQREAEDKQILADVPTVFDGNTKAVSAGRIEAGTHGFLIHFDQDIQNYVETGEKGPPNTQRNHHFSDCMFIPCDGSFARRPQFNQKYNWLIANLDGSSGVGIHDLGVDFWGDVFTFNGLPMTTMNPGPPATFQAVPPNNAQRYENRRQ